MTTFKKIVFQAALAITVLLALFVGWAGWLAFSVHNAIAKYRPEVGDVLIQNIDPCGRLLRTVKGVTQSKWCHCGVVDRKNGKWVVCEAVGDGVKYTPLSRFLLRGDEVDFVAYRLAGEYQQYAETLAKSCDAYVGRPYDIHYELDDEKIYCSELVHKAYRDASKGAGLGVVQRFGDLNWQPHKDDIVHYHGNGDLPLDREVVTPVSITRSPQLEKVFELRVALHGATSRALAFGTVILAR